MLGGDGYDGDFARASAIDGGASIVLFGFVSGDGYYVFLRVVGFVPGLAILGSDDFIERRVFKCVLGRLVRGIVRNRGVCRIKEVFVMNDDSTLSGFFDCFLRLVFVIPGLVGRVCVDVKGQDVYFLGVVMNVVTAFASWVGYNGSLSKNVAFLIRVRGSRRVFDNGVKFRNCFVAGPFDAFSYCDLLDRLITGLGLGFDAVWATFAIGAKGVGLPFFLLNFFNCRYQ